MARQNKSDRAAKILTYIVLVLLLVALFGFVAYLTDCGRSDIKTFSLTIGDRVVMRDEGGFTIQSGDEITVNSFEDYTVEVYAFSEYQDFEFISGQERKNWSDLSDKELLSSSDSGLDISFTDGGFILHYDSLQSIISNTSPVMLNESVRGDIFAMYVTSGDSTICVTFGVGQLNVITDITFEPPALVF